MPDLDVIELDQDELALAWPLVRTSCPRLEPAGWQALAESLIDRGGGVLGVAAPDRALHGVATYETIEKPKFGRVLHVDTLVTFELSGRAPARAVLVGALRRISEERGCSATLISARKRPPPRTYRRRTPWVR